MPYMSSRADEMLMSTLLGYGKVNMLSAVVEDANWGVVSTMDDENIAPAKANSMRKMVSNRNPL
jgi:hypothetical protein